MQSDESLDRGNVINNHAKREEFDEFSDWVVVEEGDARGRAAAALTQMPNADIRLHPEVKASAESTYNDIMLIHDALKKELERSRSTNEDLKRQLDEEQTARNEETENLKEQDKRISDSKKYLEGSEAELTRLRQKALEQDKRNSEHQAAKLLVERMERLEVQRRERIDILRRNVAAAEASDTLMRRTSTQRTANIQRMKAQVIRIQTQKQKRFEEADRRTCAKLQQELENLEATRKDLAANLETKKQDCNTAQARLATARTKFHSARAQYVAALQHFKAVAGTFVLIEWMSTSDVESII